MTHEEAKSRDLATLYVQNRLDPAERQTFEDHYFGCRECFDELEAMDRMRSAVKQVVRTGEYPESGPRLWNFVAPIAIAASLLLGVVSAWLFYVREPRLTAEREQYKARVAELEKQVASAKPSGSVLPLLVLEAARAGSVTQVRAEKGATQIALWMDPPPNQAGPFRIEIRNAARVVLELADLRRNSQGGIVVAIPMELQTAGTYTVRLFAGATLVNEYRYEVTQ